MTPRHPIAEIVEAVNRSAPPTPWDGFAAAVYLARVDSRWSFAAIGAHFLQDYPALYKGLNYISIGLRTNVRVIVLLIEGGVHKCLHGVPAMTFEATGVKRIIPLSKCRD